MMKKIVSIAMAAALAVSMLAGCGSTPASTASGTTAPAGSGSSTAATGKDRPKLIISCYLADDAQVAVRQNYIDGPLKEAFPNADIEIKMYNDRQSLQIEVAGGGGPDILDLDGPTDVAEFAKASRVMDLGAYAEKYGWKDMFYQWAYNSCFYKDKLYSLPTAFEGMVIYYNMDIMNANGWTIPKTLPEFEKLMADMQGKGIIPLSFGNTDYQGAVDWLYSSFLSCNAGPKNLKDAIEGKIKFDDPSMVAAIQQMTDWWQKGYIGDKASQSITTTDMMAFFAEGRAGMMMNGTWASGQLLATYPDCNWQAEMVPELREGVGQILPFATGGGYAINANSKNADLAAEVLNYLFTSTDRHYKSIIEASYQPYPLDNFDIGKLQGMDSKLLYMYEVLDTAQKENRIGYCSWTFFPSATRVYMNENTDGLFLKTITPEQYLAKAQESIDAANAAGETPAIP